MRTLVIRIASVLALAMHGAQAIAQFSEDVPFTTDVHSDSLAWTSCTELLAGIEGCEFAVIRGDLENGPAEVFVRLAPWAELPRIRHAAAERGLILQGALVRAPTRTAAEHPAAPVAIGTSRPTPSTAACAAAETSNASCTSRTTRR